MEGFTHHDLIVFYDRMKNNLINNLYDILEALEDVQFGISKAKRYGLIIKEFRNSSDNLESLLSLIKNEIITNIL
ncbi:hypothetical protein ABCY62_10775 [Acetivibrio clariflavus]|uniref:hypothetical protein n=1 Tax=Acetivibrio clariflavus TaxID=288965 RepID=UPI0031F5AE45